MNATVISWILAIVTVGIVFFFLNTPSEKPFAGLTATTPAEVVLLQEEYFAKNGKYLQIKENNTLPEYEKGEFLSKTIPANYKVHVYEAPEGKGFFVQWEDADNYYSVGYGVQAEAYTHTVPKPSLAVATST